MSAMRRTIPGASDPYGGRFLIESIPPDLYLKSSYYERWLLSFEDALLKKGLITAQELDEKTRFYQENPEAEVPREGDYELGKSARETLYPTIAPSEHDLRATTSSGSVSGLAVGIRWISVVTLSPRMIMI